MQEKASGNSWGSLKQPIDLANHEISQVKKGTPVSNVQVGLYYYTHSSRQYKFKYNLTNSKWISLEIVITNITFIYNYETQVYSLDIGDAKNLNEYVSNK